METVLAELDAMIGLQSVKQDVRALTNLLAIQALRRAKGLAAPPIALHSVFYGGPGTGKTTVARLLASIYRSLGLLKEGHLVETDRAGLVAGYVGQTAIRVSEVVTRALGGVLFIDEAYSLTDQPGAGDYGPEAIATLIKLMEDHRNELVVIVAGYTEKMKQFLATNPGLRSRFNRFFYFSEDYESDQLLDIFSHYANQHGYSASESAIRRLHEYFTEAYEALSESFGNGRMVRNLFETILNRQATRLVRLHNPSGSQLSTIEESDVPGYS
jgi:SpoVK/Ycf46/Vps4 family AAA+-type ATPase